MPSSTEPGGGAGAVGCVAADAPGGPDMPSCTTGAAADAPIGNDPFGLPNKAKIIAITTNISSHLFQKQTALKIGTIVPIWCSIVACVKSARTSSGKRHEN